VHDALLPRLRPRGSLAMMAGKLSWFAHVTEVDLTRCLVDSTLAWTSWSHSVPGPLAELGSMPSLSLPESCAESAVDAEAVYGLTMLTTLHFCREVQRVEVGEMVLDLSRLMSLTSLNLENCFTVTDKEVQALSSVTGLTSLNLEYCWKVAAAGKQALRAAIPNLTIRVRGQVSHHRTELLPPHPSAHAPQCDGVQRLAWRAA
jgi:hypothetical protein